MSPNPATLPPVGISGIASYFPTRKVPLAEWSSWTGANWDKIQAVVGDSFRVADPREDVYTMSAEAVYALLKEHDISPSSIGLLILATESSLDNAVGASTLRGLTDRKLQREGLPALDRNCETYEIKQACLAGVYGIKQALRWAMLMPPNRHAIVVSADIAEYELGSTGEPTQGAGAIATLITQAPKLLELDPRIAGSASLDRETDFRKPHGRSTESRLPSARPSDFPVFDGPYSTSAYLDSVCTAFDNLVRIDALQHQEDKSPLAFDRLFFHRPYRQLPERAAATLLAKSLQTPGATPRAAELRETLDKSAATTDQDVVALGKLIHKSSVYTDQLEPRLELGKELTAQFGNLYTASLPAWLGAGFVDALENGKQLSEESWLLLGYGSGDAAEALVGNVVPGWQEAAKKINFRAALREHTLLGAEDYRALHHKGELVDGPKPAIYRKSVVGGEESTSVIPKYEVE